MDDQVVATGEGAGKRTTSDLPMGVPIIAKPSSEGEYMIVCAEYSSLRQEILKMIEMQFQVISILVVALGAMLSVALQSKIAAIAFTFPFLSLFLCVIWQNKAHAISRCSIYLALELEPRVGSNLLGWESWVRLNPPTRGVIGYLGVRSIFPGSSLAATVVGAFFIRGIAESIYFAVAVIVTVNIIILLIVWREASPKVRYLEIASKRRPESE